MAVTFQLPRRIEDELRGKLADLDRAAKEAALVDLYRRHLLTHHELAEALDLPRLQVDGVLKEHGVMHEWSLDDIARESASISAER